MALQEWKALGGLAILVFSVMIISMYVVCIILENKKKKIKRQQVSHIRHKNNFKIDYDEFVKTVFKKQEYIGQAKSRKAELIRLVG